MDEERNPELRIVGGHPALDLVNTVAPRIPGGTQHHEYLASPADLLTWARRIEVISAEDEAAVARAWRTSPATAAQARHATLDIREATYAVLAATVQDAALAEDGAVAEGAVAEGATLAEAAAPALDRLALRWSAACARSTLVPDPRAGHVARLVVGTNPGLMIPDRLAHAAVDLLRSADLSRLRACPLDEGGCGWLFLDYSRNGSRRWCAMADCGTQAKVRRLTQRRRATRATPISG